MNGTLVLVLHSMHFRDVGTFGYSFQPQKFKTRQHCLESSTDPRAVHQSSCVLLFASQVPYARTITLSCK